MFKILDKETTLLLHMLFGTISLSSGTPPNDNQQLLPGHSVHLGKKSTIYPFCAFALNLDDVSEKEKLRPLETNVL